MTYTTILNYNNGLFYVYSETCSHCSSIKQKVISYRLDKNYPLYFIPFNNDIPIISDPTKLIGVDKVEDIAVVGVPSLFHIYNKKIISYVVGGDDVISYLENFRPIPS